MRWTAAEYARTLRAIVIGAGRFVSDDVPPLDARIDAEGVERALQDVAACGVPPEHVITIFDRAAAKTSVLDALTSQVTACTEQDTLVIYFSGHGVREGDEFHLRVHDGTVTAKEIATICATRRLRGVLLIADCCNGEAFATCAPDFFRELGGSDFRIALFSSRFGQRAWDLGDGKGSLFTRCLVRVLKGEEATGGVPGEITYFGLAQTVRFLVNEQLAAGAGVDEQDPVATVSAIGDPLLFVNARQAMERLSVETDRVSRAHMRKRMLRFAALFVGAAILIPTLVAGWASMYYFAQVEGEETVLYQGYPGVDLLGLPIMEVKLAFAKDAFATDRPLANDEPVIARSRDTLLRAIRDDRNLALSGWSLAGEGDFEKAWDFLSAATNPGGERTEVLSASSGIMLNALRYRIWMPADLNRLVQMVDSDNTETRSAAILRLLERDPARAYDLLSEDVLRRKHDHREVLLNTGVECSPEKQGYFDALLNSADLQNLRYHLIMAWDTSECPLSVAQAAKLAAVLDFDALALLPKFIEGAGSNFEDLLRNDDIPLPRRLALLAAYPDARCNANNLRPTEAESILARAYYALHLGRRCSGATLTTAVSGSEVSIAIASQRDEFPEFVLNFADVIDRLDTPDAVAFTPLSQLLVEQQQKVAEPYLLQQVASGNISAISWRAVDTMRRLGLSWRPGQAFIRGANYHQHTLEYFVWQATAAPEEAQRTAFERLGDSRWSYVTEFFARAPPSAALFFQARDEFKGPLSPRTFSLAELLAMYGNEDVLSELSNHAEPRVRATLLNYGPFNEGFEKWLSEQTGKEFLEPFSVREGQRRIEFLREFGALALSPPDALRCWQIRLALGREQMTQELGAAWLMPTGVRMRLQKIVEELCR